MGKYILYLVVVFVVAFGLNFFGIVRIPFLDIPFATDAGYYTKGSDRRADMAKEVLGEKDNKDEEEEY